MSEKLSEYFADILEKHGGFVHYDFMRGQVIQFRDQALALEDERDALQVELDCAKKHWAQEIESHRITKLELEHYREGK